MKYHDYYKTLGVERSASADEIKKAYRKQARKYHPDVSKEAGAEDKFKAVNEAYEVLRDEEKRQAYDHLGSNWKNGADFQAPPGWGQQGYGGFSQGFGSAGGAGGGAQFSDFFENMFGQGGFGPGQAGPGFAGQRSARRPKADQELELSITLEEAFSGAQKSIQLSQPDEHGRPQVRALNVKIPAGVRDGQKIRLSGQASEGGDLYLKLRLGSHARFQVDEQNRVHLQLPLAPWEAALGAQVEIPTLAGSVNMKIPAGSQTGQKLRLKGRGLGKPAADQLVEIQIRLPKVESEQQKALFKQMQEQFPGFDPRA